MIKDILTTCKNLLYDYPFYGSVLLGLQKEVSKKIDTACIGLQGVTYKLLINEDFWKSLQENQKLGLLMHELLHIVFFHPTEYRHLVNKDIANIAMDIYVNQKIPKDNLPPKPITWDQFENLQADMDTNWYYDRLMENHEEQSDQALEDLLQAMGQGEDGEGEANGMATPNHDWEEIEEASEAVQKMLNKNMEVMLNEIVKTMSNPGSIPGGLEELLEQLSQVEPPKFNWRAYVKRFVGISTRVDVKKTRRKRSKRFPDMAGSKEQYYSRILVGIDTSASVRENELREFQNELYHMHKTGHDIEIICCDTQIQDQYMFNPREPLSVKGRGGTYFAPVVNYFQENLQKYSCLIYLTDGESWDVDEARGNILWVHSSDSEINESLPGKKIKLEL